MVGVPNPVAAPLLPAIALLREAPHRDQAGAPVVIQAVAEVAAVTLVVAAAPLGLILLDRAEVAPPHPGAVGLAHHPVAVDVHVDDA